MTDARRSSLMPGFASHVAEISGVATHWYEAGAEGPAVVLVHGLGGAGANWTALGPLLARGRRVLAPDLPGHGLSAPLPSLEHLSDLARHVAALAAARDALPCTVVGHSLGGVVALRLAALEREVRAVALVCSAGIASTSRRAERSLAITAALQPAKLLARVRGPVAAHPLLRRLAFGSWGADDARTLSAASALGYLEGPAHATGVAAVSRALVRDDPRTDLHGVACPALVVWGARDRLTPVRDGIELARRLGAPLRIVPGTGHLLPAEAPEACAAILEPFLVSAV